MSHALATPFQTSKNLVQISNTKGFRILWLDYLQWTFNQVPSARQSFGIASSAIYSVHTQDVLRSYAIDIMIILSRTIYLKFSA